MAWAVRYVRADSSGGGDGTADTTSGATAAFTLAEAITHSTTNTGVQYNVMASGGTFSNTTTIRTFSGAGTTSAPNWWRGNNTTLGDIEADHTLTKPLIDFTTGNAVVSGALQYFSNIRFNSAATTGTNPGTMRVSGTDVKIWGCRFENTAANSNSVALSVAGARSVVRSCFMAATSSANALVTAIDGIYFGNYISGGSIGISCLTRAYIVFNIIDDPASHGISLDTTGAVVLGNSIYSAGGDGIRIAGTTVSLHVANNILANSAGYGVNFSSGSNGATVLFGNAYRSNTSGEVNGLTEDWRWGEQTLGFDPWTNAASDDFSLVSSAKALGLPSWFENETFVSYMDPGAVQRQEPSGGGGLLRHPGMAGGVLG